MHCLPDTEVIYFICPLKGSHCSCKWLWTYSPIFSLRTLKWINITYKHCDIQFIEIFSHFDLPLCIFTIQFLIFRTCYIYFCFIKWHCIEGFSFFYFFKTVLCGDFPFSYISGINKSNTREICHYCIRIFI